MDKRTVFITGAANGIGEATAILFASRGWYVGLYDIDINKLSTLAEKLGVKNCCYSECDITDEQSVVNAFDNFSAHTGGKLDALIANAGIIYQGPFDSHTPEQYKRLINVNAFGTINTVFGGLKMLKNTLHSHIVITSSSSALFGIPTFAVYGATKAFLKSFTEATSSEFIKYNINVSSVMPLFVQTKMMNDIDSKHKALLTPENIATVILRAATIGKSRHYLIGKNLKVMSLLIRLLPTKLAEKIMRTYLHE